MKRRITGWAPKLIIILACLGLLLWGLWDWQAARADANQRSAANETCATTYRRDAAISVADGIIRVEKVTTNDERVRGLSGRSCIGYADGMLFDFATPGQYDIWMHEMRFPIDIVWLDSDFKVVTVRENIRPETYPATFTSDAPAWYVLELQANRAKSAGIQPGRQLSIPEPVRD